MFSGREPWFRPFTVDIQPMVSRRLGGCLYSFGIIRQGARRRVNAKFRKKKVIYFISSRIKNLMNQVHNAGKIKPRYRFPKKKGVGGYSNATYVLVWHGGGIYLGRKHLGFLFPGVWEIR